MFGDTIHNVSFRKGQQRGNIALDTWFQHFKSLLEVNVDNYIISVDDIFYDEQESYVNRPISEEEVLLAFKKLKLRKAAGPDGIVSDILKYSNDQVVAFFLKLFNSLFEKGIFHDNWTELIILPLFKKGDANNHNNYRGIALNDVSSKLYGSIINSRLQEWVEENNITGEHQAEYTRSYSTIDHMFALLA